MRPKLYQVVVILLVVIAGQVLLLRGTVRPTTVSDVQGLQSFQYLETVSDGGQIWTDDFANSTGWSTAGGVVKGLQVAGAATFSASFPITSTPQSASVSRTLALPLGPDPVISMTVAVSQGVSYGVRFFGITPTKTSFPAWREGSSLQHRPGLGTPETITANLSVESFLANQKLEPSGSTITQLQLYLEVPRGVGGTFSIIITSLSVRSLQHNRLSSLEASGNFRGVTIDLGSLQLLATPFQVFVGFDIKGTEDLTYAPDLVRGMAITAQGYTYVPKTVTTHELAVLNPVTAPSPSPFRTGADSSSTSVVVSALAGGITYFKIDSVSLRTTSQPPVFGASINPVSVEPVVVYYLFFLFVVPVSMVILAWVVYRREK